MYTCQADDSLGLHNPAKLWVSDPDHRLLKIEAETHGSLSTKAHPVPEPINNRWVVRYDYDPTIQIKLLAK